MSDEPGVLSDAELVRAAQSGEVTALGTLLARHRAGMRAVALGVLGYGPDADDAVQDASLTAVSRIGDLRDPAAVGPWLRMVTRNAGRMRLRAPQAVAVPETLPALGPTPDQVVEEGALRDWVWHAIGELSEPLRLAVLLRHFSGVTSYEQIAAACEVPVGTVRSRLNAARTSLADALLTTADLTHDDIAEKTERSKAEALDTLAAAERGAFAEVVADRWTPDAELLAGAVRGGVGTMIDGMNCDLEAGVRQRFGAALVSRDLTLWEMDLVNPPDDPDHCPPGVIWMMSHRGGRYHRLRLFHPA
ncbi:RNA polymerase sigma factor [Umezawaea sp. NPDC059074]|uniref:RNA polymerase sigma factor n=1 Tax=Umezawaea sp. NPDC059074 TaxID=3346716 RepID=UPI0036AED83E